MSCLTEVHGPRVPKQQGSSGNMKQSEPFQSLGPSFVGSHARNWYQHPRCDWSSFANFALWETTMQCKNPPFVHWKWLFSSYLWATKDMGWIPEPWIHMSSAWLTFCHLFPWLLTKDTQIVHDDDDDDDDHHHHHNQQHSCIASISFAPPYALFNAYIIVSWYIYIYLYTCISYTHMINWTNHHDHHPTKALFIHCQHLLGSLGWNRWGLPLQAGSVVATWWGKTPWIFRWV